MRPTINQNTTSTEQKGDTIYINVYAKISKDDIVVAKVDWHNDMIIKRVVGTPGDKIEIKDLGENFGVFVNDILLYTKDKYGENTIESKSGSYEYFADYKKFLNNPEFDDYVVHENGTAFIQLEENEYFLMGDNWGQTTDSITKGPVKTNEIVGKVDYIVDVKNNNRFTEIKFFFTKLFSKN